MGRPDAANKLGAEPVGRLLLRFSIPAMTGMVLNALYNVVDRIFVGRGVGEIALGGLSLVNPLMTLTMAFSMLFGLGAANMISMRLGQKRRGDAESALRHGFCLLILSSALIILVEVLFFDHIIALLGAKGDSLALGYAERYYRIILGGTAFFMVSFGLSHCARAQGFPLISMIGMIIGALTNTALDPLFIFGFGWGVEGAAWATLISWTLSSIWVLRFCAGKKALIRLRLVRERPSWAVMRSILSFGSPQFLMQIAIAAVLLLFNYSMGWYGVAALGREDGSDIAQAAMNVVQTVTMLILMPVFGINQGAQPVLGFNYGAKNFARVKKAFLGAVAAASIICVAGFLVVEIAPVFIVRLFAPEGSREFIELSAWALRIANLSLAIDGFQIVSSNMFVVTGRPRTSIVLSLTRQVLALIPLMLIFGRLWGLHGVVYSMPAADIISAALTAVFVVIELKKINAAHRNRAA